MDAIIKIFNAMDERTDPISNDYFLLNSSAQAVGILIAYLLFSIWIGPAIMLNRKAFDLIIVLRAYNLFQVVSCLAFAISTIYTTNHHKTNILCDIPESGSDDSYLQTVRRLHWFYFLFKFLDFMDTIFFILRKKNNHVTFLHVYHHSIMYAMAWGSSKFAPSPVSSLLGILNSIVHSFMYFYYFLASFGPKYNKYLLKWKIYLTRMQIAQFIILGIQGAISLLSDCTSNKIIPLSFVLQGCIFTYLFTQFYIRTYMVKKPCIEKKTK